MHKNQLQELAQRSCFSLPSYTSIREGPDHAPRFKALVNFNGDTFESPHHCSTLRQAEHSAAEVALHSLSTRHSLAARILDETGVYKNLLQEIAQRVGAPLPHYTTYRSGLGHLPIFTGTVDLAAVVFTGEPAKNKKQAEKNAAMAAWCSLKQLAKESATSSSETENTDELEQITIARALINYRFKEKVALADSPTGSIPFMIKFSSRSPRPTSPLPSAPATSKILPLICPRSSRNRFPTSSSSSSESSVPLIHSASLDNRAARPRFPTAYVPMRSFRTTPCRGMAPPVTIRSAIPVFSTPPRPPPNRLSSPMAPPVCIRQAVPTFAAPTAPKVDVFASPAQKEPQASTTIAPVDKQSPTEAVISVAPSDESVPLAKEGTFNKAWKMQEDSDLADVAVQNLKELKM